MIPIIDPGSFGEPPGRSPLQSVSRSRLDPRHMILGRGWSPPFLESESGPDPLATSPHPGGRGSQKSGSLALRERVGVRVLRARSSLRGEPRPDGPRSDLSETVRPRGAPGTQLMGFRGLAAMRCALAVHPLLTKTPFCPCGRFPSPVCRSGSGEMPAQNEPIGGLGKKQELRKLHRRRQADFDLPTPETCVPSP